MSKTTSKFSPEVRERAIRLVLDHEHPSQWAAIASIAAKIGCTAQTRNEWVKKAAVDAGKRAGVPTEILRKASAHLSSRRPSLQSQGGLQVVPRAPPLWSCEVLVKV